MRKTLTFLAILTLAVCIGVLGVAFAFATAPTVSISADIYHGDYTAEDRNDVEGKATVAFGEFTNVADQDYGVVVATYGNEWSGQASKLKYYAKGNNEGKFGVAIYGLSDGFYKMQAYVYDKNSKEYTYSESEVPFAIGYSTVSLVRPEADDIVKYVKTGTAFADPGISGVDRWNTYDGTTYTTYDFSAVVEEDITLYAETIEYTLASNEPIELFTNKSLSGSDYTQEPVILPTITANSSLKGEYTVDGDWQQTAGNPTLVVSDGKVSATGKLSGEAVLTSSDYELEVTVKSPVLGAKDLDELSLVTFYGDVVASSEYFGKAQQYLDGHYELINDIDYATYTRENDTLAQPAISGIQDVGYMLPIATFSQQEVDNVMVKYADTVRNSHGMGRTSSYSKTWLSILGEYLEEVVEDYVPETGIGAGNTYKKYSLQVKAGVKGEGSEASTFVGINPASRNFRGVLDGAGKTISNAWLMLDNYLVKISKQGANEPTMATGQVMHFIGKNKGTVENIIFNNLGMGSSMDYYGYWVRGDIYCANLHRTALGILGYSGIDANGALGVLSGGNNPGSATNRKYYTTSAYDREVYDVTPVSIQSAGWGSGVVAPTPTSIATALIAVNEGTINNLVMNYRSSANNTNGSSGMPSDANGLCWVNETSGVVSNVIINRLGQNQRLHNDALTDMPVGGCTQRLGAVTNNGTFTNTYIFATAATNATALKGTGTYGVTVLADGDGTVATNDITVSAMDTTNCSEFIKQYVLGLQG